MLEPGDVVLTKVQYTDTFEVKRRPAVVLFEEMNNVVIAGVTSNLNMAGNSHKLAHPSSSLTMRMDGVPLTKEEGAVKESVIKLNYIFTVSNQMVEKVLFKLSEEKKMKVFEGLDKRLVGLKAK